MDTSEIHRLLEEARRQALDINEHLPTLIALSGSCSQVCELGVRDGSSTVAFLSGGCDRLDSWDIVRTANVDAIMIAASDKWTFHHADSTDPSLPPCDLLFIDSFHTADHLSKELNAHASKVRVRIVLHDTESFGKTGENGDAGMRDALLDFLLDHSSEWVIEKHYRNNNGLTILRRLA